MQSNANHTILILAQPTPGDARFQERWKEVGSLADSPGDQDTDIIVTDFRTTIDDAMLSCYPYLKYVVSPTTGHTHLVADFQARGVELITLKGHREFLDTVWSTAEFTMHLILRLSREIEPYMLLRGSTLGIVGFGRVGRQVSTLASSFGMRVIHVDKDSPEWAWKNLFKQSDFVSIHVDENPTSRKLINRERLEMMKPTACLVNTSRASVIDEEALFDRANYFRGCALDMLAGDWSPSSRFILTDHLGGSAVQDRIKTAEFCLELLKQKMGRRYVRQTG